MVLTGVLRLWGEESGQGMIEYAIIIVFIALACFTGLKLMGQILSELIKQAAQEFEN